MHDKLDLKATVTHLQSNEPFHCPATVNVTQSETRTYVNHRRYRIRRLAGRTIRGREGKTEDVEALAEGLEEAFAEVVRIERGIPKTAQTSTSYHVKKNQGRLTKMNVDSAIERITSYRTAPRTRDFRRNRKERRITIHKHT